jgi:hydrogenase nickel incorporation protein HypB
MGTNTVHVNRDIRAEQLRAASDFRQRMANQGTYVVRLLSSPGAGKTALLEATAAQLGKRYRVGILVGDIETERDAERLRPYAPTIQITTGGACHLEIPLVENAYARFCDHNFDFLFIEDVGNLVCPASHDLGEHFRVVLLSTTEGDDKPGKYPKAFRGSHALVISKTDLLPYVPFTVQRAIEDARCIQPNLRVITLSALSGEGIEEWCNLLVRERRLFMESTDSISEHRQRVP